MDRSFESEVHRVVAFLAPGEVVSYSDVAHDAGRPGAARAVGTVMARSGGTLPWWRVVYSDGRLPPADPTKQAQLLRGEDVVIRDGRVAESPAGRFSRYR